MYVTSIIFSFCFLFLGISSHAEDDENELVQIPKKLFTELMQKRDELIRLKSGYSSKKEETTILHPLLDKIELFLKKIRQWKDNIVKKADIDEHVAELKQALNISKKSVKEFFVAGKEGGIQVFHIGRKVLKIALRLQKDGNDA